MEDELAADESAPTPQEEQAFLERDDIPEFKQGATFRSWAELLFSAKRFQVVENVLFRKSNMKRVDHLNATMDPSHMRFPEHFVYASGTLACKHAGTTRTTGNGVRNQQSSMKIECPCVAVIGSSRRGGFLRINQFNPNHNHKVNRQRFELYPENRRMQDDFLNQARNLLACNVTASQVAEYISRMSGKRVLSQDIKNIRVVKDSQQYGFIEGFDQILAMEPGNEGTMWEDPEKDVDMIYFQSGTMKRNLAKFPEVMIMDTTHNVNNKEMKLTTLMVIDNFNRGQVVAHALMAHETKDMMIRFLEHFVETNRDELKRTKVMIVDKCTAETKAIEAVLPGIPVHLCLFHVKKALFTQLSTLRLNKRYKAELEDLIDEVVDAHTRDDFDEAVETLYEQPGIADFLGYFDRNWLKCEHVWAQYSRKGLPTMDTRTTNHLESFHRAIKLHVPPNATLYNCVLLMYKYTHTKEMREGAEEIIRGMKYTYNQTDKSPTANKLYRVYTKVAARKMLGEKAKLKDKDLKFRMKELPTGQFLVTVNRIEYVVTMNEEEHTCSCTFQQDKLMICRHGFFVMEHKDWGLNCNWVAPRWRQDHDMRHSSVIEGIVPENPKNVPGTAPLRFNESMGTLTKIGNLFSVADNDEYRYHMANMKRYWKAWLAGKLVTVVVGDGRRTGGEGEESSAANAPTETDDKSHTGEGDVEEKKTSAAEEKAPPTKSRKKRKRVYVEDTDDEYDTPSNPDVRDKKVPVTAFREGPSVEAAVTYEDITTDQDQIQVPPSYTELDENEDEEEYAESIMMDEGEEQRDSRREGADACSITSEDKQKTTFRAEPKGLAQTRACSEDKKDAAPVDESKSTQNQNEISEEGKVGRSGDWGKQDKPREAKVKEVNIEANNTANKKGVNEKEEDRSTRKRFPLMQDCGADSCDEPTSSEENDPNKDTMPLREKYNREKELLKKDETNPGEKNMQKTHEESRCTSEDSEKEVTFNPRKVNKDDYSGKGTTQTDDTLPLGDNFRNEGPMFNRGRPKKSHEHVQPSSTSEESETEVFFNLRKTDNGDDNGKETTQSDDTLPLRDNFRKEAHGLNSKIENLSEISTHLDDTLPGTQGHRIKTQVASNSSGDSEKEVTFNPRNIQKSADSEKEITFKTREHGRVVIKDCDGNRVFREGGVTFARTLFERPPLRKVAKKKGTHSKSKVNNKTGAKRDLGKGKSPKTASVKKEKSSPKHSTPKPKTTDVEDIGKSDEKSQAEGKARNVSSDKVVGKKGRKRVPKGSLAERRRRRKKLLETTSSEEECPRLRVTRKKRKAPEEWPTPEKKRRRTAPTKRSEAEENTPKRGIGRRNEEEEEEEDAGGYKDSTVYAFLSRHGPAQLRNLLHTVKTVEAPPAASTNPRSYDTDPIVSLERDLTRRENDHTDILNHARASIKHFMREELGEYERGRQWELCNIMALVTTYAFINRMHLIEAIPTLYPLPHLPNTQKNAIERPTMKRKDLRKYSIGNNTIYNNDLCNLNDGDWLCDNVINIYLGYMAQEENAINPKTVFVMPSQTAQMWLKNNYTSVFSKIPLMEYKWVFLPVNPGHHWLLMAANMENLELTILDSVHNPTRTRNWTARWLNFMRERNTALAEEQGTWTVRKTQSCPQSDGDSCGLFTLMNATAILTGLRVETMRMAHTANYRKHVAMTIVQNMHLSDRPICEMPDCLEPESGGEEAQPLQNCDNCGKWGHLQCVGLTEKPPNLMRWYCPYCAD